jgi:Flp pilus assembly pilin Flp
MIDTLRTLGRRLLGDARGLTTVEYTIVLCLIAALCVGVWKGFGEELEGYITTSKSKLNDNITPALAR